MHMKPCVFGGLLAVILGLQHTEAGELLKPPAVWKDYDPDKGDFKEEIIRQETKDGIYGSSE